METSSMKDYKNEIEQRWGETKAYNEYSKKTKNYSKDKWNNIIAGMDNIINEFSVSMKEGKSADSLEVQNLVNILQKYITDNYYECTKEILAGLGKMYIADERFRNNMNKHGEGTAEFISKAIEVHCMIK